MSLLDRLIAGVLTGLLMSAVALTAQPRIASAETAYLFQTPISPWPGQYGTGYVFGSAWAWGACPAGTLKQHIGIDMYGAVNQPVSAAGAGTYYSSIQDGNNGWAMLIQHTLPDGSNVVTQYWHVQQPSIADSSEVNRGQYLAQLIDLSALQVREHIHFAVHTGVVTLPWSWDGALPTTDCGGRPAFPGAFVDPQNFLRTHARPPDSPGVYSTSGQFTLRRTNNQADLTTIGPFSYGDPTLDRPVVGNWAGLNKETPAVVRYEALAGGLQWRKSDDYVGTANPVWGPYGNEGNDLVAGDWTGSGRDYPGVFSSGYWSLYTVPTSPFQYGNPGDMPVVGDWTGQGKKTVGIVRLEMGHYWWYLRNSNDTGSHDIRWGPFGDPGDVPVVGDWASYGRDSMGVYRPNGTWYLYPLTTPITSFGATGDRPMAGSWNPP